MKYQEILDCLSAEWKGNNADLGPLVASIKDFFDDDLRHPEAGDTFTCKKNGRVHIVSKNVEVVSRFRKLSSEDVELEARWEQLQSSRS